MNDQHVDHIKFVSYKMAIGVIILSTEVLMMAFIQYVGKVVCPSANKGLKLNETREIIRMISRVSFSFKQVTRFMILALFVNHSVQNEYF